MNIINFCIFNFFLYLLPLFFYLKKDNILQLSIIEIAFTFFSIVGIFFISIIFSKILSTIKNLKFRNLLLSSSFFFYISFYFTKLRDFFSSLNISFSSELSFLILILISILFLFLIKVRKIYNFFLKFLKIFLSISLLLFLIQITQLLFSSSIQNNLSSIKYNFESDYNNPIFLLIFDGLDSIDLMLKDEVITYEEFLDFKTYFENKDFKINTNALTTYGQTTLSISSMINFNYPHISKSIDKLNYDIFFPQEIWEDKPNTTLLRILNNKKYKFYHIGNWWNNCKQTLVVSCLYVTNKEKLIYILTSLGLNFYNESFFSKFFYYREKIRMFYRLSSNVLQNELMTQNKDSLKRKFFLVHQLSPHSPYLDKNCEYNNLDGTYQNSYKCNLKIMKELTEKILSIDEDSIIIITGDHGWNYRQKTMNLIYQNSNCKVDQSNIINIMGTIFNCTFGIDFNNLTPKYYSVEDKIIKEFDIFE